MSSFDQIIGYEQEKKELNQIADVLKNSDIYKKLGVSSPRGLLLHGEPGVGKTLPWTAVWVRRRKAVCSLSARNPI